jgi:hypothetical protein
MPAKCFRGAGRGAGEIANVLGLAVDVVNGDDVVEGS